MARFSSWNVAGSDASLRASTHRRALARLARLVVCVFVGMSARGEAQGLAGDPEPTPRQLVVDPLGQPSGQQGLRLTLSAFEAYSRNNLSRTPSTTTVDPTDPSAPIYQQSGFYSGATGALNFGLSRRRGRAAFGVNARTGLNAYSRGSRLLLTNGTGANASLPLGRRTDLDASGSFSYAPFYNFGPLGALDPAVGSSNGFGAIDPNVEFAVRPIRMFRYGTQIGLNHVISRRSSLSGYFTETFTAFPEVEPNRHGRSVGVRFTRSMSQNLSLHFGYAFGRGETASSNVRPQTHNIDIGANYGRALSFSPRTTFRFSTGSTLLADGGAGSRIVFDRRHFRLTGSANLVHDIGRTWSLRLDYLRGWDFVDLFESPFFHDTVTIGLGGSLGRRATFGARAGYLKGSVGGFSSDQQDAWTGSSVLRVALGRAFSFYTQYNYYQYQFSNVSQLPAGYPTALARSGARVGLSASVPLFR